MVIVLSMPVQGGAGFVSVTWRFFNHRLGVNAQLEGNAQRLKGWAPAASSKLPIVGGGPKRKASSSVTLPNACPELLAPRFDAVVR
jgi:hypothetical protein